MSERADARRASQPLTAAGSAGQYAGGLLVSTMSQQGACPHARTRAAVRNLVRRALSASPKYRGFVHGVSKGRHQAAGGNPVSS